MAIKVIKQYLGIYKPRIYGFIASIFRLIVKAREVVKFKEEL